MTISAAPTTIGQTTSEGGIDYIAIETAPASGVLIWQIAPAAVAAGTDLSVGTVTATDVPVNSSTGADIASLPVATATTAGVMVATDKDKLDNIEPAATADQNASEVPVVASGNLAATDVQGALDELQSDIDGLQSVTGNYVGASATFAGLPTTDVDGTAALEPGDMAILSADDGANQSGIYAWDGAAWQLAVQMTDPALPATDAVSGLVELADNAEAAAGTDATRAVTPASLAAAVPSLETDTTLTQAGHVATYTGEDNVAVTRDFRTPVLGTLPADDTEYTDVIISGSTNIPNGRWSWTGATWAQG